MKQPSKLKPIPVKDEDEAMPNEIITLFEFYLVDYRILKFEAQKLQRTRELYTVVTVRPGLGLILQYPAVIKAVYLTLKL